MGYGYKQQSVVVSRAVYRWGTPYVGNKGDSLSVEILRNVFPGTQSLAALGHGLFAQHILRDMECSLARTLHHQELLAIRTRAKTDRQTDRQKIERVCSDDPIPLTNKQTHLLQVGIATLQSLKLKT